MECSTAPQPQPNWRALRARDKSVRPRSRFRLQVPMRLDACGWKCKGCARHNPAHLPRKRSFRIIARLRLVHRLRICFWMYLTLESEAATVAKRNGSCVGAKGFFTLSGARAVQRPEVPLCLEKSRLGIRETTEILHTVPRSTFTTKLWVQKFRRRSSVE